VREEIGSNVATDGEHRRQIGLYNRLEIGEGELVTGMSALDASAVEENVDAVVWKGRWVAEEVGDQCADFGVGREVGVCNYAFAPEICDLCLCGDVFGIALQPD
jgi:hypothetical protein